MQRQFARPTGPGAGVIKYDVLTALSLLALREHQTVQTTVLRLIALVTARYNWKSDQFCVPQPDMARMWQVSERTVKREVKRMVSAGFIRCIRPGVRGRVGAYRLNYDALIEKSRPAWPDVGTDYDSRMQTLVPQAETKVVKVDFARKAAPPQDIPAATDTPWSGVLRELAASDPANLHNWYMKLRWVSAENGHVVLAAPSGFVAQFVRTHLAQALHAALARHLGQPVKLEITC